MYKQALNSAKRCKSKWFWGWVGISLLLKLLPFWPTFYHESIFPIIKKYYILPLSNISGSTLIYFYLFFILSFILIWYFRGFKRILKYSLFLLTIFWWLWGYNYGYQSKSYTKMELNSKPLHFWKQELVDWIDASEKLIEQGALNDAPAKINGSYRKAQPAGILSFWGNSGFYFPFSGQAYYAQGLHTLDQNFTIRHELMHQEGIASESLCNYIAIQQGLASPSKHDQLGVHIHIIGHLMQYIGQYESAYIPDFPQGLAQLKLDRQEWYRGWSGAGADIQNTVYHLFLKSNGESEGMLSYYDDLAYLYGNELRFK